MFTKSPKSPMCKLKESEEFVPGAVCLEWADWFGAKFLEESKGRINKGWAVIPDMRHLLKGTLHQFGKYRPHPKMRFVSNIFFGSALLDPGGLNFRQRCWHFCGIPYPPSPIRPARVQKTLIKGPLITHPPPPLAFQFFFHSVVQIHQNFCLDLKVCGSASIDKQWWTGSGSGSPSLRHPVQQSPTYLLNTDTYLSLLVSTS